MRCTAEDKIPFVLVLTIACFRQFCTELKTFCFVFNGWIVLNMKWIPFKDGSRSWSDPPNNFENMNGKMVHSISNAILLLQRQVWKPDRTCTLKLFVTICNLREKIKTRYLKHAFWHYLQRFGNEVNLLKTSSL